MILFFYNDLFAGLHGYQITPKTTPSALIYGGSFIIAKPHYGRANNYNARSLI